MSGDQFAIEGPITANALQAATVALIAQEAWADGYVLRYSSADGKLHPVAVPAGPAPSGAANLIYASPNGSSGAATLRALVGDDIADGLIANAKLANYSITVSAGAGLSGGGAVSLGGSTSLSLPNVGPGAGAVAYPASIMLDAQGRVAAATPGSAPPALPLSRANGGFGSDVSGLGTGLLAQTASNTWAVRSVAQGSGITVTNGDGVAGNPTVALTSNSVTVTAGTGLSGGGSVSLGSSTSLSVSYGSTAGTSAQGNDTRLLPTPSGAGKVPYDNGSAYVEAAAGAATDVFHGGTTPGFAALSLPMLPAPVVTKLTGSGTWAQTAGARLVKVQVAGGGAGGGSGRQGTAAASAGGSGGAGGGYVEYTFLASDLPATVSYTVGAGGTGGAAQASGGTDGNPGILGSPSNFGTYLYARGGSAGIGGTSSASTGLTGPGGASQFLGSQGSAGLSNSSGGNAATSVSGLAGTGGGGGAGPSAGTFNAGGFGGALYAYLSTATGGIGGATVGAAGANGATGIAIVGSAAGGGASGDHLGTVAGGAGGNGGTASGGGGGGGSVTGAASGKGGNGGDGAIWVTEW